jgi:hypothetical protein
MGWLKLGSGSPAQTQQLRQVELKVATQHVESLSIDSEALQQCQHVSLSVPDSELPFIPPDEVSKRRSALEGGLCECPTFFSDPGSVAEDSQVIVVDEIVYDCTRFILEHPGGQQIIESFAGAECTWQFWRFHGKREMDEFGRPLRVGRTKGLQNKFKEPVKYVGLRSLGDDGWD